MFKIGDVVVYSVSGVCLVEDICTKSFGDFSYEYYVLKPLLQSASTVFVPVKNATLTKKIHHILCRSDFDNVFLTYKNRECPCIDLKTESERHDCFMEILENGDRASLMLLVNELYAFGQHQLQNGRRLHIGDEKLLKTAENLLFEEIAYVYQIDKNDVSEFIKQKVNN